VLGPGEGNAGDPSRRVEFKKFEVGHGSYP
jgi:hypothetical protein